MEGLLFSSQLHPTAGPRGKPFPVLSLIFLICKIKGLNFGQIFSENTFLFPLHENPHVYTPEAQVGWCLWNLSEQYLLSWILTGHTIKAMYLSLLMSEPEKQTSQVLKTPWEVNSFSSRLWVQHQLELFSFLFDIKIPHFIAAIMLITRVDLLIFPMSETRMSAKFLHGRVLRRGPKSIFSHKMDH